MPRIGPIQSELTLLWDKVEKDRYCIGLRIVNLKDPTPFHLSIFPHVVSYIQVYLCVCLCVPGLVNYKKINCKELWGRRHDSQPSTTPLHHLHLVCGLNERPSTSVQRSIRAPTTHRVITHSGVIESCVPYALLLRRGNFVVNEVLLRRDYC